jgi:heme-degrading monooxygenase HmoA
VIEFVYEFVVKEQARGRFELAYGPGGAWSSLFADSPGFRGATLLRDTEDPRRYLAIDVWDTESHRAQALAERGDDYAALEAAFDDWTESRAELGAFRVQTEASVRPFGKARRRSR